MRHKPPLARNRYSRSTGRSAHEDERECGASALGLGMLKLTRTGASRRNLVATAGMLAAMSFIVCGPLERVAFARVALTACLAGCAAVYGLPVLATARGPRSRRHADALAAVLAMSMVAMVVLA